MITPKLHQNYIAKSLLYIGNYIFTAISKSIMATILSLIFLYSRENDYV